MTNDGDALFRALCEQPWEDTPRLVYADWLEENGDPRRAEFIRVQVAYANNPSLRDLQTRAKQLQTESRGAWTRGSPTGRDIRIGRELHRGFYHQAWFASAKLFLTRATDAFDWAPIEALWLRQVADETIGKILAVPYLARLTRLTIAESSFGDDGCCAVAQCSHLARVTRLRVWGRRVGDVGLTALSDSPHLRNVCELSISADRCSDAGVFALLNSPYLTRVTALELHNPVGLSDPVVNELKRRFPRYGHYSYDGSP